MRTILHVGAALLTASAALADVISLTTVPGDPGAAEYVCSEPIQTGVDGSFVIDVRLDPVLESSGNDHADIGIVLELASPDTSVHAQLSQRSSPSVGFVVSESADRGEWNLLLDGTDVSVAPPDSGSTRNGELQRPNVFATHSGPYRIVLVGTPHRGGTRLRMYFDHLDRPVEDHVVFRKIEPQHVGFFATLDSEAVTPATMRVASIESRSGSADEVEVEQSATEAVLAAIDWSHASMSAWREAYVQGRIDEAAAGITRYLQTRTSPPGAPLIEMYYGSNFIEIADAAIEGRYGTLGHGAAFSNKFAGEHGMPRWELDSGYLNRHFHWCSLAKAYEQTNDEAYAQRFAAEVSSWVRQEPFFVRDTPYIPGIDWMDGTVFRVGYMNTSNIGRRCEMTWWPAYEVFRRTESFDTETHIDMLLGFIRQARLLTNPTSFAWWDDGGAHGTLALLQTALMLPELRESANWRKIAEDRLRIVIQKQFYPDGSHVSLSTGYNFATIHALENVVRLYRRFGIDAAFVTEPLQNAYRHPMTLARPVKRGQVDLNDGGWGPIDDHLTFGAELLPEDDALQWFASSGERGSPRSLGSTYFPNAGQAVMRTGWGEHDRYLLFDAGPVGASHGKEDKLALTLDVGGNVLLGNGGRAGYDEPQLGKYTGSIYAQNTLNVDRLDQSRIPRRREIYGWKPEKRRWFTNDHFDYVEGFHTDGWYGPSRSVQGTHIRQILCLKGANPPEDTYFLVIDSVAFDDDKTHQCEVMWHARLDHMSVNESSLQVDAWDTRGAVRIIPLDTLGLQSETTVGQSEPRMIGWEVYGSAKKGRATVMHRWTSRGSSTKAWLLIPSAAGEEWCVASVERGSDQRSDQLLQVHVFRKDGAVDDIRCELVDGEEIPVVTVLCKDPRSTPIASFDLSEHAIETTGTH